MPPARPASTVVLLRPSASGFEVFLVRRHDTVAFMGGAHVFPGGRVDDSDIAEEEAMRHRLAAVRELEEEAGVRIGVDALTPFAHWVTPDIEIKRFDTWFFLAEMPAAQAAVHDGTEHSDSLWVDPADAVAMARRGDIALPPPTWTTLQTLAAFATIDDVLRWARTTAIVRIQPEVEERDGVKTLLTPRGRFVLENGRWKSSG
jgi:8-oxo-dGTP pyrophosphatase MutT (NUDIX family)